MATVDLRHIINELFRAMMEHPDPGDRDEEKAQLQGIWVEIETMISGEKSTVDTLQLEKHSWTWMYDPHFIKLCVYETSSVKQAINRWNADGKVMKATEWVKGYAAATHALAHGL
ncbi:MAG: hypothetical protein Q7U84_01900 [Polynucleobacter sp.]|nr:hypothetical protein [Polynucleobacter sp.]